MLSFIGEQIKIYQDTQSAAKSRKELISKDPSLDLETPGPSRIASYHSGLAEKSCSKSSHKDVMGSTLNEGDGSGDELDITGSMDGHNEDIIG